MSANSPSSSSPPPTTGPAGPESALSALEGAEDAATQFRALLAQAAATVTTSSSADARSHLPRTSASTTVSITTTSKTASVSGSGYESGPASPASHTIAAAVVTLSAAPSPLAPSSSSQALQRVLSTAIAAGMPSSPGGVATVHQHLNSPAYTGGATTTVTATHTTTTSVMSPKSPLGGGGGVGPPSPQPSASSGSNETVLPQQFCLRWNNYQSNLTCVFDQLLRSECFVDVTLACDGGSIKAHKMVLSACSPYFQALLADTPCHHPIVIMRDVQWPELRALVEFMYKGEINVSQEQIGPLLRVAELLKVRGLADVNGSAASAAAAAGVNKGLVYGGEPKFRAAKEAASDDDAASLSASPPTSLQRRSAEREVAAKERSHADDVLEKKIRLGRSGEWSFNVPASSPGASVAAPDLGMSPLHQQLSRASVRKRRWPSADTIHFNPPESPLSGLIAAERAEREREKERDRERRERTTPPLTPPAGDHQQQQLHHRQHSAMEMVSPVPRSSVSSSGQVLASGRTPTHSLATSPQLGHMHRSSPHQSGGGASTPSAAGVGDLSAARFQLGSQAAAMAAAAAAAAHIDMKSTGIGHLGGHLGHAVHGHGHGHGHVPSSGGRLQQGAMAQSEASQQQSSAQQPPPPPPPPSASMLTGPSAGHHSSSLVDDLEIKPGIAEMIREEERAKMMENSHGWMGASGSSIADSYQYQLQSMWQKCWNTNQNLMHHLRFRERGPLKSWRPETMAEAIFSVLKEGLSLSQAARKYDIPYPTFVLYANRVHNMLGPSIDGGPDLRPKGRGRPQRILLGIWPDDHIKGVIKTVVFRDSKEMKDDSSSMAHLPYGRHSPNFPFQESPITYPAVGPNAACPNGMPSGSSAAEHQMSQEATAAAVAAVAHNLRQHMQLAAVAQQQQQHQQHLAQLQHGDAAGGGGGVSGAVAGGYASGPGNLFNFPPHLQSHLVAAASASAGPPSGGPGAASLTLPKPSISPAINSAAGASTAAAASVAGSMMGPRHAPSPCGPGMPIVPMHMVGGPSARCDPSAAAALLSQQQQHQMQQLHLQQQHALQQQHGHGSFVPMGSSAASSSGHHHSHHMHLQQQQQLHLQTQQQHQAQQSIGSGAASAKAQPPASPHEERQRAASSSSMLTTPTSLHSPLTELGLDMVYKSARGFSPSRIFPDDITDLMSAIPPPPPTSSAQASATSTPPSACAATTITTTTKSSGRTSGASSSPTGCAEATSTVGDSMRSGASIKMEPLTTSGE